MCDMRDVMSCNKYKRQTTTFSAATAAAAIVSIYVYVYLFSHSAHDESCSIKTQTYKIEMS